MSAGSGRQNQPQLAGHAHAAEGLLQGQSPAMAVAAMGEAANPVANDAAEQAQPGSDLVPYAHASADASLLASGVLEQQMSAEISALMSAALQSGRQIDVELPSGAIMRIR